MRQLIDQFSEVIISLFSCGCHPKWPLGAEEGGLKTSWNTSLHLLQVPLIWEYDLSIHPLRSKHLLDKTFTHFLTLQMTHMHRKNNNKKKNHKKTQNCIILKRNELYNSSSNKEGKDSTWKRSGVWQELTESEEATLPGVGVANEDNKPKWETVKPPMTYCHNTSKRLTWRNHHFLLHVLPRNGTRRGSGEIVQAWELYQFKSEL